MGSGRGGASAASHSRGGRGGGLTAGHPRLHPTGKTVEVACGAERAGYQISYLVARHAEGRQRSGDPQGRGTLRVAARRAGQVVYLRDRQSGGHRESPGFDRRGIGHGTGVVNRTRRARQLIRQRLHGRHDPRRGHTFGGALERLLHERRRGQSPRARLRRDGAHLRRCVSGQPSLERIGRRLLSEQGAGRAQREEQRDDIRQGPAASPPRPTD